MQCRCTILYRKRQVPSDGYISSDPLIHRNKEIMFHPIYIYHLYKIYDTGIRTLLFNPYWRIRSGSFLLALFREVTFYSILYCTSYFMVYGQNLFGVGPTI